MAVIRSTEIVIPTQHTSLPGILNLPSGAKGIIAFAHGSGSSRFSSRNRSVAQELNHSGFATLLFDLLNAEENVRDNLTAEYRFNIPMLARRLIQTVDWLAQDDQTSALPVGLFGASTGAAAALIAAAERPERVKAVVSRGGRVDLADISLPKVRAATLLVVGELDHQVINLNKQAAGQMTCEHQLVLVPGATHLFEEPGTLERVAMLADDWFTRHLAPQPRLSRAAPTLFIGN
ncbi:MAG: alpha/beta fold hydrolase [Gammaproteobacteria bacterium]|nr:alpha/beta fold hydrolase [Gammaproteobacteria bacterium]